MSKHLIATSLTLLTTALLLADSMRAQGGRTPLRANWKDLETWTRPVAGSRESEVGLGLQTGGSQGTMMVAFAAKRDLNNRRSVPTEITMHAAEAVSSNPLVIRDRVLKIMLNASLPTRRTIDLSTRLTVDDPSPGAAIAYGIALLTPAEFRAIRQAKTVALDIYGVPATLRADQLKALQVFGDRANVAGLIARP